MNLSLASNHSLTSNRIFAITLTHATPTSLIVTTTSKYTKIRISAFEGVVEHGLSLDMETAVTIAGKDGVGITINCELKPSLFLAPPLSQCNAAHSGPSIPAIGSPQAAPGPSASVTPSGAISPIATPSAPLEDHRLLLQLLLHPTVGQRQFHLRVNLHRLPLLSGAQLGVYRLLKMVFMINLVVLQFVVEIKTVHG